MVRPLTQRRQNGKQKKEYVWLNVLPQDIWVKVPPGETIWKALRDTSVEVDGDCGGLGQCGKCRVKVLSSPGPPSERERELLGEEELSQGIRLACRTEIDRDLVISTEKIDSAADYVQILTTSHIKRSSHLPILCLEPLVEKRVVTLPDGVQSEGLSDLERIRLGLGPEYEASSAPLDCLRSLPEALRATGSNGAAVLHGDCLMCWQNPDQVNRQYGLVFDLGTSTLVGKIIHLVDGSEVAVASRLNSQIRHGTNVISRLQYAKEQPKGVENLNRLMVEDLNHIATRLLETAGLDAGDVFVAVAAGNTTMQHLCLKLDPSCIAEAPFSPVVTDGLVVRASDVGLKLHPNAVFYMMPAKSGYVGGDLIGVILASGAAEQEDEIVLGLDLGTNGEIFLGNGSRMATCSAAAGPALEGARISAGMIARAGAIQSVSFEKGHLHYLVVGNIKPKGICGSGLVELVAVLLELGVIDHEGLIRVPESSVAQELRSRVVERSGVNDFMVCSAEESYDGKPIYLTQRDVRELQLAKAAVAAGVKTLMDELDITTDDISRVYLAGALGNYVNRYSAMRIGLIPRFSTEIVTSLGNAASTGAAMVLSSRGYWQTARGLARSIEHVELSFRADFNEHFLEQMDFPREDMLFLFTGEISDHVMGGVRVAEVMTDDYPSVPPTATVGEVSNLLRDTGHHGFPVVDENGRLFGMVTIADLWNSLETGHPGLTAADIATRELFVAFPDQSLDEILQADGADYGRIPVVDRQDKGRLVGVLLRRNMMNAYRRRLEDTEAAGERSS